MVTAVGKGIDRAHGKMEVCPKVMKSFSWDLLTRGEERSRGVRLDGG